MANADINSKEFVVIAELTEDCQFLKIHHYKPLSRLIRHLLDKKLEVGIKLFKYTRSDSQNRWLWGVAYVTVCSWFKEISGEKISKETIHAYTKQVILGGQENETVALTKTEFNSLISELHELSQTKSVEDIHKILAVAIPEWLVSMRVDTVLGNRVLVDVKEVSTKAMTTTQFSDLKDSLQAHWAEKGCDIPDPRENNLLSDYVDE